MFGKKTDHNAVAIIPARLGSTRFPRKALADDTGKPMVVHVCEQAAKAQSVSRVVVATDADEIKSAVESHGFEAVMTDPTHTNGTSRLAETTKILKLNPSQLIVNVQGDEPEIEPEIIDAAVQAACLECKNPWYPEAGPAAPAVGTVGSPLESTDDINNPNIVKAVLGQYYDASKIANALYFSRAPIPFDRDSANESTHYRHVGIYAYAVSTLNIYMILKPTPLEQTESLEQLRWLEYGYPIAVAIRQSSHTGIDTPEQYRAFVERFRQSN